MPTPTDTSWNIRKLNRAFAAAAILLLLAVLALVLVDHARPWRTYQREGRVWDVALVRDAADAAAEAAQRAGLARLQRELTDLRAQVDRSTVAALQDELASLEADAQKLRLPTAAVKGELGPLTQQIERASLTHGPASEQVRILRAELTRKQRDYDQKATRLASLEAQISERQAAMAAAQEAALHLQRRIDELTRQETGLQDRLAALRPRGVMPRVADVVRNAPLLDWLNPSEKVQQVVVPGVRTDLNFVTTETIDRCQTCHVNIDDAAYEPSNLLLFIERQIAQLEGQDLRDVAHPVVMLDFWERTIDQLGLTKRRNEARGSLLESLNRMRRRAAMAELADEPGLSAALADIATHQAAVPLGDGTAITRQQWVEPITWHLRDLRNIVQSALGEDDFKLLVDQYRFAAVDRYNTLRGDRDLPQLSANPVLLGHPRMELYVDPDSKHAISSMGCTVCHEGAGQETLFEHTAHTPREIWVDAVSGTPVPQPLISQVGGSSQLRRMLARPTPDANSEASEAASQEMPHGSEHSRTAVYSQHDVNLNGGDGEPFAPRHQPHGDAAIYQPPTADRPRLAIRQSDYWAKTYGWHPIHYMHWEKPMHAMEYIESSCNKCHTEIFDLQQDAPRLFEGRQLFAQVGCVNCHAVSSLDDDLDIRKIGPSLVHLSDKLSQEMIASWIWSPKGFRPLARMPHYFMLENNSSPTDLLRTRTEVAAMTHYLLTTPPAPSAPAYEPEPVPASLADAGDARRGRALFNSVGCLACHTNMAEHGRELIVDDLVEREGLDQTAAARRYEGMSFNQRQWYALEHLADKIDQTGPELSAVGTKLRTGRTEAQARVWLYDWLRNPRHYAVDTIMPDLRLTEAEAVDLSAYLLSLQREDWRPGDFTLSHDGERMLEELIVTLQSGRTTPQLAREEIADWPTDQRLTFLGQKMIAHYGCSGCHTINGFEQAVSACTNLDDWGIKDPHKLDFGYFDHAFDPQRRQPLSVWKVGHEGLDAGAPQIGQMIYDVETASDATHKVLLAWEHMDLERRPFLYHKLHNPRVYDRGRFPQLAADDDPVGETQTSIDVGRPYDKLKMPKFFLTDQQVRALVTYVTAIRPPLVDESLMVRDESTLRIARGRQIATLYNCYGCHNIEGNSVHIQQFYDVTNPDGTYNYDQLNTAPPRLVGQAAKTQPQWLTHFLNNVHPIRPWLQVRMPSFAFKDGHEVKLAEYFAGWSRREAQTLRDALAVVDQTIRQAPDSDWFEREAIAAALTTLHDFALRFDLAKSWEFSPRRTDRAQRRATWERVVRDARFLASLYDAQYPFPYAPTIDLTPEQFARGQALFGELRCIQCHVLGDERTLIDLWKLDHPEADVAQSGADDGDGYDDLYGDDPYADSPHDDAAAQDDPHGESEDNYGEDAAYDDDATDSAGTQPRSVDELGIMVYRHSAPNLNLVARRLQWNWVDAWLQEPATIQPGTAMPQWFPGGHSAFANYPESYRRQVDAMYGSEGADQRKVLMGFLWAAGNRNYTPGAERLHGVAKTTIELTPLVQPASISATRGADADGAPASDEQAASSTPAADKASDPNDAVSPPSSSADAPLTEPRASGPLQEQPTTPYEGEPTHGQRTRVVGRVLFSAPPPVRRPVRMEADAYCVQQHQDLPRSEAMVVGAGGEVANVLVHIVEGLPEQRWPTPGNVAEIDQIGCMYVPHVLAMQTDQPLRIVTSDNTLHNVKMSSSRNGAFNESMPVKGMELRKTLSSPELGIGLKCDVHPWMGAYLHVLPHPFFAVTDAAGRYEIHGLPPGDYVIEAWHESGRVPPQRQRLSIAPETSHRLDMTLTPQ